MVVETAPQEGGQLSKEGKMKKIFSLLVVAALSTAILGTAAASATTKGPVVKTGTCTGHATWKLTLNPDVVAGRQMIEADSELFRLANGQSWKSTFKDNGVVFGSSITTAKNNEASSTRLATNQAGSDLIRVRSVNLTTGQVCVATAAF
jgi:hypothetical protein